MIERGRVFLKREKKKERRRRKDREFPIESAYCRCNGRWLDASRSIKSINTARARARASWTMSFLLYWQLLSMSSSGSVSFVRTCTDHADGTFKGTGSWHERRASCGGKWVGCETREEEGPRKKRSEWWCTDATDVTMFFRQKMDSGRVCVNTCVLCETRVSWFL